MLSPKTSLLAPMHRTVSISGQHPLIWQLPWRPAAGAAGRGYRGWVVGAGGEWCSSARCVVGQVHVHVHACTPRGAGVPSL